MAAPPRPVFDSARVRFWCGALLLAYAAFLAARALRGYWPHLPDFSMFWAAGRLALAGKAASAYDWDSIRRLQPFAARVYQFYYPPFFLIVLAPLALLPFAAAAAVWVAAGLAAYLAAMRAILPGRTAMLAALAAPAAVVNLISGQNGLLLAAVLGGGLAWLDERPMAAGVLIGLAAFKPQFGALLPLFLALTGRWRVFAGAALTVSGLALCALLLFGWRAWAAFVAAFRLGGTAFAAHPAAPGVIRWEDLSSVYGMLRVFGAGATTAWAGHIAVAAAAGLAALALGVARVSPDLKAAALLIAAFLLTPYSELNDMTLLVAALAFVLRDGLLAGLGRGQALALAAAYAVPALDLFLPGGNLAQAHFAWPVGPAAAALSAAVIAARVATGRRGRSPQLAQQ